MIITNSMPEPTGPTLTTVTHAARQTLKWGGLFLVALIVGRFALTTGMEYYARLYPAPPPPPTVGFGVLPKLIFPPESNPRPRQYVLETPTGTFPVFGDRAKVLFSPVPTVSLLADQEMKQVAAEFGFVFEPVALSSELLRFEKSGAYTSVFEANTRTKSLKITSDFLSHPELIGTAPVTDPYVTSTQLKTLLASLKLVGTDVATAEPTRVFYRSAGGQMVPAVSESDAEFVQIDINRYPIDSKYKMYTSQGEKGTISIIVAAGDRSRLVESLVSLDLNYNFVDYTQTHTYPLRTAQTAWQLLQSGEGFVVQSTSDTAIVRTVELGYYDSFEHQQFLQPVYIFKGDNGFLAYVSALSPDFVQK